MKELQRKVADLITSQEKLIIFEIVSSSTGTFTSKDIFNQLQDQGIKVNRATVQTFLRGLWYRRYLKQFSHKLGTAKGRSTIHFQKVE